MPSRSTWTKIAIGIAVVLILYLILSSRRCRCNMPKSMVPVVTAVPMRQVATSPPMVNPELFAPYDPEDEPEEEEPYADYVPEEREDYVDAADVYSSPEFKSELLDA